MLWLRVPVWGLCSIGSGNVAPARQVDPTAAMPKTNAPVFKTFCEFEFDEESAAAVYLLRG